MASYTSLPRHVRHHSEASSSQQTLRDSTYSSSLQYSPKTESYALLGLPSPGMGKTPMSTPPASAALGGRFDENVTGTAKYLNPYYLYPVAVIVIHTLLLTLSWTFFSITINNPVPLSPRMAVKARDHIQSVTMMVTLLASFISVIAGVLYTRAIRYSLARFVSSSVSLYVVTAVTKLAKKSPIKNFRRPIWTIASVILAIAVNAQTAGWTTLLIPKSIEIVSDMRGFELDIQSFGFRKLMEDNAAVVNAGRFTRVMPITEASGATAVSTLYNLPAILNLNHFSFNNSTLGIMPVATRETESKISSVTGDTIPVNVEIARVDDAPPGFPVRFSMTQQGFSAHVKCEQRQLSGSTRPSLNLRSQKDTLFNATVTLAQIEVICPTASVPSYSEPVLTSDNVDALFGISCPVNQINGAQRWDLILTGSGPLYRSFNTTVCSIWPEVNTVDIDYSDNTFVLNRTNSFPNFINGSQSWGGTPAPWLGNFALSVFLQGLKVGQTTTGNSMGDAVMTFLSTHTDDPDALTKILEQYVRGVLELSITLLRTIYTQNNNGLFPGGNSTIPESMRVATNGTYRATTIGWNQSQETAATVLLAPTFISIVSILIIVATLAYKFGSHENPATHFFDPGDILHIIAASSAGGLKDVFPPYHENNIENNETTRITLAPTDGPGSRPGFICTKSHSYR